MKKNLSLYLVLFALLLCSCGQPSVGDASSGRSRQEEGPTWQEQYDLGVRYLSEGNYEEAILAFTAAIEIDPKRAEAYEGLADVYVALDDIESALEILRQGEEAIGDDTLFQSRVDELTSQMEATSESKPDQAQSESVPSEPAPAEPRVERESRANGSYRLRYYDEAGNITRDEYYDSEEILDAYWLFYYDAAGNVTRREYYYPDGTLGEYFLDYYNAVENVTRSEGYDPDGTLSEYFLDYYDAAGNVARSERYDPDGTLTSINYYDAAENMTREEYYNPDGTLREAFDYN